MREKSHPSKPIPGGRFAKDSDPLSQKIKERKMEQGTRIYFHGDMANSEGTGTVIEIKETKWGTDIIIKMDDGRDITVSPCNFSSEYKGNGLTRFVTLEAFNSYRKEKFGKYYGDCGLVYRPITEIK